MIIYRAINRTNGKGYAGQSVSTLKSRIASHKYHSKKFDYLFDRAIRKYGIEGFDWEIIEECRSIDELNEREVHWIAYYDYTNPEKGYNIEIGGKNSFLSEETKRKISVSKMGVRKGVKQSSEWVKKRTEKIKGENNGMFGREPINKKKIDEKKLFEMYLGGYSSRQLARFFNLGKTTILRRLKKMKCVMHYKTGG